MRPTKREMEECLGGKKMKKDTRERIERYTQEIPHVKEKLFITGLGLLMATVMTVSASFAWIMLSVAPEVSSINTTLASNGSLEIALSNDKGTDPEESDIDEQALPSDELSATNVQWGNLVSLNDPSYGISDLTLRPAQLNTGALGTSPLWAASYGEDGRITGLGSKFVYAKYDPTQKQFMASADFGVRAISSYKTSTTEATAQEYEVKYNALLNAHRDVNEFYSTNITTKFVNGNLEGVIGDLGGIVSVYLQSIINGTSYRISSEINLPLNEKQVTALLTLYQTLQQGMELQKEALMQLSNLQQYVYSRQHIDEATNRPLDFTPLSWENLLTEKETYDSKGTSHKKPSDRKAPIDAVSINGLKQFINDLDTVQKNITVLENHIKNIGNVKTDDVKPQINDVCDPYQAKVDGYTVNQWLNRGLGQLANLANGRHLVQICNGTLRNFEQFAIDTDSRLPRIKDWQSEYRNGTVLRAKARALGMDNQIKMTAHVCTNANGDSYFMSDFGALPADINASEKVAEDTYGMAIDLWLRTNSEKTYLTLEGAVVKDAENGTVSSFDGVNRVWNTIPNAALTSNSTTQGNGSCYTYYVDTPEDLQRSLRLLKNMKVAFFGTADGKKFATAVMDIENYYAQNGRVTVPLVIDTKDCMEYTYEDTINSVEKTGHAIKEMYADEAIRVTALIYLDGNNLTNEDVLAAETILGQLNIQFGSSVPLTTAGDRTLESAQRYVTAELSNTTNLEFIKGQTLPKTDVTVTVQGKQPDKMTAYFVRSINDLQGTRQKEMAFTFDKQSVTWKSTHEFTAPGNYWLRHIRMDGVDYELVTPLSVAVTGFDVTSVTWDKGATPYTYYTVDDSHDVSVDVNLAFDKEENTPHAVTAVFMGDDGNAINIRTSAKDGTAKVWSGKVTFTDSGTYTLSHVIVDGNYYDVGSSKKVMNLYFGLSAAIYNDGCTTEDKFDKDSPNKTYEKAVNVSILDNSGNELPELADQVTLNYSLGGSDFTIPTELTWNAETKCYTGTIVLKTPGRYIFSSLEIGNDTIRRVVMSPTYTIMAPDAPQYDSDSATGYNDANGRQYALQSDKAYITGIKIDNSESAGISAVLYNEATEKYYLVARGDNDNKPGTIYLTEGKTWSIRLPNIAEDNRATAIDGKWSVVCIKLWNCYDGASTTACTENNPLVWLNTTSEATAYAEEKNLSASKSIDFSKLNTDVISTITVKMNPGNTKLGGKNTAFMAQHKVSELGISVKFSDYMGNPIPQEKLNTVTLNIDYRANKDAAKYGYEVMDSANRSYTIPLTYSSDHWDIKTTDYIWQYVGEYKVSGLQITASGITKNYTHDNANGIPAMYTVTSKAPSMADVRISDPRYSNTEYGKGYYSNSPFLSSFKPDARVTVYLTAKDVNRQQFAIADVKVKLTMDYKNGTVAPNGGYSWSGSSGYEHYELIMTPDKDNVYSVPDEVVLLAGEYELRGTVSVGSDTKELEQLHYRIQVYSQRPKMSITNIKPSGTIKVSRTGSIFSDENAFTATNHYVSDYAVAYMSFKPFDGWGKYMWGSSPMSTKEHCEKYARYTIPTVTVRMEDMGDGFVTTLILPADYGNITHRFDLNNDSNAFPIGLIATGTDSSFKTTTEHAGNTITYETQKVDKLFGTHTISEVTSKVNGITFRRLLEYPVTISQTATPPATTTGKLTYTVPTGITASVAQTKNSSTVSSGTSLKEFTNVTVTLNADEGYCNPRMTKPADVYNWNVISEGAEQAKYSFSMPGKDTSLNMTVKAYPKLSFTADAASATTEVTVNGDPKNTDTGIKPGETVTVTVTAKRDNHYCLPQLTEPAGIQLSKTVSDYCKVYTFTMPDKEVTIPVPTVTQMHKVSWDSSAGAKLIFFVKDTEGSSLDNGGYTIPGRQITVTAVANGGNNPQMTVSGANVVLKPDTTDTGVTSRVYTFAMPTADITLGGSMMPLPTKMLTYRTEGNEYAKIVAVTVNGIAATPVVTDGTAMVSIPVGSKVEITLQAKTYPTVNISKQGRGYYNPRMAVSTVGGVALSGPTLGVPEDPEAYYGKAAYTFTMPDQNVDLTGEMFTATAAPKIVIKKESAVTTSHFYRMSVYYVDTYGEKTMTEISTAIFTFKDAGDKGVTFTYALPGTKADIVISAIKPNEDKLTLTVAGQKITPIKKSTSETITRLTFTVAVGTEDVVATIGLTE